MPKPVQIGAATVFHGDCSVLCPSVGLADAVVTDPPYHLFAPGHAQMDFALTGNGIASVYQLALL